MSATGKGKKREDRDNASDDDTELHAPPRKTTKKDSDDNSDNILVCEIGKNRRVSVRIWKGISLSVDQWNVLRNHIEEIDTALTESS